MVCCALLVPCCHESARQQLIHCQARSFRIWSTDIAYPIPFFSIIFVITQETKQQHITAFHFFAIVMLTNYHLSLFSYWLLLLCWRRREISDDYTYMRTIRVPYIPAGCWIVIKLHQQKFPVLFPFFLGKVTATRELSWAVIIVNRTNIN